MSDQKKFEELNTLKDLLVSQLKRKDAQNNFEIIFGICVEVSKGSRDFSISNIGAISESRGSVKTQVIRNKSGERYQLIISAFEKEFQAVPTVSSVLQKSWIERIEDPAAKLEAKILANEKKKLLTENNILRNLLSKSDEPIVSIGSHTKTVKTTGISLSDHEMRVIKDIEKLIQPGRLSTRGCKIGEDGELKDSEGKLILPRGFQQLIEKLLTISDEV